MQTLKLILFVCSLFAGFYLNGQSCDNICMDFDGVDDEVNTPVLIGASGFTIEMWYLSRDTSTNTDPLDNFRRLFSFSGSPNTSLQVGLSGGEITLEWTDSGSNSLPTTNIPSTQNVGLWNHLALTRNGQDITVYLNCQAIWNGTLVNNWNIGGFVLGPLTGILTTEKHWLGQIDDVRIWNFAKTQVQIDAQKHCVLSGNETDLALYYTFDEGIANGNNTALSSVIDLSTNALNGNLNNFTLTGATSNFVNSTAGLVYPNYNNLGLEISDYPYKTAPLTEICNGDPTHFCLDKNGITPPPNPNVNVQWEHSDDAGVTWVSDPNPPFNDFCFAMPTGNLTTVCTGSPEGFVERQYRAKSQVFSPVLNETCDYFSEVQDLKICCPISPATITLQPGDPLCENETLSVNVTLTSPDQFVNTPGSMTSIDWFYDDGTGAVNIGNTNQTTFPYTLTTPNIPTPGTPLQICFSAIINHCTKSATITQCLTVDPEPQCGEIIGLPNPNTLTLVATTPHTTYQICPGNDAALGIDPANPFNDCIPEWQYSFDGNAPWSSMGYSNTQQNTNILPTIQPPVPWPAGTTSIFYRIKCNPLSSPSGCEPCFSDMIEVMLTPDPIVSAIGGTSLACKEDLPVLLQVAPQDPSYSYTWYCDGLVVGTGLDYQATKEACYWVETSNGCIFTQSAPLCLTVCEVVPLLSCPESPNECAKLGEPITLSACASYISCDNNNTALIYEWTIDGVLQTTTSCNMPPHTPLATGSLYEVTVTDTFHGCSATTSRFVKPCELDD